jgi:DNA primase
LLCGDSKKNQYKKRFNLDWNNGVPGWKCWNCGRSGNFIEIYSIVKGITYDDAKLEIFKFNKESVIDRMKKYNKRPNNTKKNKKINEENYDWIKKNCYTIYDEENRYVRALKSFYSSRKISKKMKIFICHSGRYRNRIIIPIFNKENNIIYFQARRIPKTGLNPKYDNPATPKESCILNKHKFDRNKNIIVHEGLIDAFMVGDQGTSCLGKEVNEDLIKELLKYTDKGIIIALDNDSEAYKSLRNFMHKNRYAPKVKYFLYPSIYEKYDDINEIVQNENKGIDVYKMIVDNSVNFSTAMVRLKLKKLL